MTPELSERIAAFVAFADATTRRYYAENYASLTPPTYHADIISPKWCRIVRAESAGTSRSVYAFIALEDGENKALGRVKAGDVHKPAGWKAPARHARGSVFAAEFAAFAGPTSIAYLR